MQARGELLELETEEALAHINEVVAATIIRAGEAVEAVIVEVEKTSAPTED